MLRNELITIRGILITRTNPMNQSQWRHDFSPEVHMLVGTLVPVVSTNTWWFGG
jgi:hypothetical protein